MCNTTIKNEKLKLTTKEFIKRATLLHGDKYDYSKSVYHLWSKNLTIICKTHGFFEQSPNVHLRGGGCSKCKIHEFTKGRIQFISESKTLHGNKYNYSKVIYVRAHSKVEIICPTHGSFWQTPNSHLKMRGCQKCSSSMGELYILRVVKDHRIKFETQWSFNNHKMLKGKNNRGQMYFDFYFSDHNLCIEYDGKQHFEPIKQWGGEEAFVQRQINDNVKNQFCLNNGIRLLRIPYWVSITNELITSYSNKNFTVASVLY